MFVANSRRRIVFTGELSFVENSQNPLSLSLSLSDVEIFKFKI